jgi:hypothetical protein
VPAARSHASKLLGGGADLQVEDGEFSSRSIVNTWGLFRLQFFATGDTAALSFVFDKFYLIMD